VRAALRRMAMQRYLHTKAAEVAAAAAAVVPAAAAVAGSAASSTNGGGGLSLDVVKRELTDQ
jgi:hypothetical protein